ncbi:hypothetical protein, partial [Burkholderia gladioli]|uniref:hypothetical protein n=1 Tax=Burkholderia gladioli TaxID=28095 RepID=UPI001E3413D2
MALPVADRDIVLVVDGIERQRDLRGAIGARIEIDDPGTPLRLLETDRPGEAGDHAVAKVRGLPGIGLDHLLDALGGEADPQPGRLAEGEQRLPDHAQAARGVGGKARGIGR